MRLPRFFLFGGMASVVGVGALLACSSDPATTPRIDGGSKPPPPPPRPPSDGGSDGTTPLPDAGPGSGRVYAQTPDTLHLYDPIARKLTRIGAFDCTNGEAVIDLAVNRTGDMFATTADYLLTVDPTSGHCQVKATAPIDAFYPNSLSFVPIGTVSQSDEALVGYAATLAADDADQYVQIDTTTGVMTKIGVLNPPGAATLYSASGDFISLLRDGNKTYLTVRDRAVDAGVATDKLAEINPATGQILRIVGETNQKHIFGLGYWAGKAYGFSDDGRITEIDVSNGAATVLQTLTADGGAVPWYGAGVTTNAPISP